MRTADPELAARRRAEILGAASRCFAEHGFHATSMDAIAEAAGVSLGLVYRYFANKEALILAAATTERDETIAALEALADEPDIVDRLVALIRDELVSSLSDDRARLASEVLAEAIRNETLGARLAEDEGAVRKAFVRLLASHQRAGRIRSELNATALADLLSAVFDGLPIRAQVFDTFKPRATIDLLEHMVRAAITPSG